MLAAIAIAMHQPMSSDQAKVVANEYGVSYDEARQVVNEMLAAQEVAEQDMLNSAMEA